MHLLTNHFLHPLLLLVTLLTSDHQCSVTEEKLIKNLFKSYNKLIRPVKNSSDHVVITMDLVLLQLINVYEKEQIMKTNVWINLQWLDFQLNWTTSDYKVGSIRVPYDRVWTPDIVLFNNADGNYEASYKPNVLVYADIQESPGYTNILWIPPAIYKSSCTIDVKYFPFDEQQCEMRFGSWTFDAKQVRLRQLKPMVNLEDYLPSGTWDVIEVPGKEQEFVESNRMELVYTFKIRRKTLFYTVNLIIPTVLISFLSIFVFYLPTDEGEKMTLCISILLALVVFLLLVSKILPPTSMVIPLISKYLIFTLMMNIITILNTVIIINWNYRTPRTHNMPQWIRIVLIGFLPRILFMERPKAAKKETENLENEALKTFRREKDVNLKYDCASGGYSASLLKCPLNRDQDSYLTKEVSIPIIKSSSINFDNKNNSHLSNNNTSSNLNNNQNNKNAFRNAHVYQTSNASSLPRQKQQQHKNLDVVAANLSINVHAKQQERTAKSHQHFIDDHEVDYSGVKQSQLLKINRVDSMTSICKAPDQTTTSILNSNNRTNTTSGNANPNLIRRTNFNERRKQFSYSSQSRSLEDALNETTQSDNENSNCTKPIEFSMEIMEAADKVTYITNHIKSENYYEEMRDDWKYVALVIDRLLLIIFFSVTVIGTALILFNAPHIFQFVDQQEILSQLIKANHF